MTFRKMIYTSIVVSFCCHVALLALLLLLIPVASRAADNPTSKRLERELNASANATSAAIVNGVVRDQRQLSEVLKLRQEIDFLTVQYYGESNPDARRLIQTKINRLKAQLKRVNR